MKTILFVLILLAASLPAWAAERTRVGEVVITATKVEEAVENVAQDVTVITAAEIQNGSFSSVAEVLNHAGATQIRSYGNRGELATASIRGSSAQQVLILLDGKRLNKPSDGLFDLSVLPVPLESIERIEIMRGASSALYGGDAMGGVINIITKLPADPFTKVALTYGRFDTWNSTLTTARKIGSFGYLFSATREESSGFRQNTDYETWGLNSKFTFDLAKDFHVDFNADYNHRDAGAPGSIAFPSPLARQRDENIFIGITARFKDSALKLYNNSSRISYSDPNPVWPTKSVNKNHVMGLDLQNSFLIGTSNLVTGGIELVEESVESTMIGNRSRTRKGIFIQDEITLIPDLMLNIGLRYDNFEDGQRSSPRAALLYKFMKNTTFRIAVGQGYRVPTLNDLYWFEDWGFGGGLFGNPDLQPEKSTEYEFSVEQIFSKHVKAKALVFQKNVDDLIRWQEVIPFWRYEAQNIDKARIKGFEISAEVQYDFLRIDAHYTYQDPVNRETNERIYDLPRHQASGILTVFPIKGLVLSLEGRYVSNYRPSNESWCYFTLDSKVSKKLPLSFGEGELFIAGRNLLNRDFETTRGYPMPPIEFTGGVTVRF